MLIIDMLGGVGPGFCEEVDGGVLFTSSTS